MEFSIEGRRTKRGAFTGATVIGAVAEHEPDHKELSGTGRHWTSQWNNVDGSLVLVEDYTNSGKDHSYIHQEPDSLSPVQSCALEQFRAEHGLD